MITVPAARIRNPLPQLVPSRIDRLLVRIEALIHGAAATLAVRGSPMQDQLIDLAAAQELNFVAVAPGESFGPSGSESRWKQRWFQVELPAAEPEQRGRRFLHWDCDGEATIHIDGVPWAGNDVAHRINPLPDHACTMWIEVGTWQTAIWYPGQALGANQCRLRSATVVVRQSLAWECWHDLDSLQQLMWQLMSDCDQPTARGAFGLRQMPEACEPLLRRLLTLLDRAADAFDRGGLAQLKPFLSAIYAELKAAPWQPAIGRVGHAHIDLVWLWPEAVTERKGVHTFANVLRLMETYPELIFTQSQPALYRAMDRLAPALMKQIRKRIKQGRWEMQGGFEVEPDTHMPCGEALARSLAIGQAAIAAERGTTSPLCWIPDVFGYSAALPQILKLGGCTWFYTTKMTWSAITRFPYNSFVWRGADGSEILTHLCTTGYNDGVMIDAAVQALRDHRQADVHPAQLIGTGFGDGGGGPTERMCERVRRQHDLAAVPRSAWTTAEDFFTELATVQSELPVYQGELYLEYHRGTFTTQAAYKRAFRGLERALQCAEAVRVARAAAAIDEGDWQRLAFGQFHDAIPGSSIGLVYAQLNPEFHQRAERLLAQAAAELAVPTQGGATSGVAPKAAPAATTVVFNPQPFAQRRVVTVRPGQLALVDLPPCAAVTVGAEPVSAAAVVATSNTLSNGVVDARFDAHGRLIALHVGGADASLSAPAWLRWYVDEPANFDAWDIDHSCLSTPAGTIAGVTLNVVESSPLRAVLAGTGMIGESPFTIRYTLDADSRWLEIELAVDWKAHHRLLKFHTPTSWAGRAARFGTPFGSVVRSQLPGTASDEAMWEVPGSRWAVVGPEHCADHVAGGLAVCTQASYGFSCRDGDLGVSLLRSPRDPDAEADKGEHIIRLAVGVHAAHTTATVLATAAAAEALFTEPVVVAAGQPLPPRFHFDRATLGSLVPHWVKPENDGFTVRAHETAGGAGTAVLHLDPTITSVQSVDFLGRPLTPAQSVRAGHINVAYTPYQILSLRCSAAPSAGTTSKPVPQQRKKQR